MVALLELCCFPLLRGTISWSVIVAFPGHTDTHLLFYFLVHLEAYRKLVD